MTDDWVTVGGFVEQGHQIASGRNPQSPYPSGALDLQSPLFKELGLDLSGYFGGTLNISIRPYTYTLINPQYTFRQVNWTPFHPPEDFSFSRCKVVFNGVKYEGWIYYPHPETKEAHFQYPSIVEVIAPFVPGISYRESFEVLLNTAEIEVSKAPPEVV